MYKSTEWLENMKLLFVLNVDEKKMLTFLLLILKKIKPKDIPLSGTYLEAISIFSK